MSPHMDFTTVTVDDGTYECYMSLQAYNDTTHLYTGTCPYIEDDSQLRLYC